MTAGRVVGVLLAVLMLVVGGVWTLGGLGAGSSAAIWGPLLAGLGVALGITVLSGGPHRR